MTPLWRHAARYGRRVEPRWLFPGTRTLELPCGPATLDRRWRKAREKCDLEQYTFHDLRRTGNTIAALAGATMGEMKQRLRHRTSEAAERYIVAPKGADIALAQRMSELAPNKPAAPPAGNVVFGPQLLRGGTNSSPAPKPPPHHPARLGGHGAAGSRGARTLGGARQPRPQSWAAQRGPA